MTNQKQKRIYYRDRRPYLLADRTEFLAENKVNVRAIKFEYFGSVDFVYFVLFYFFGIFVEQNIDRHTKSVWVSAWKRSFTECVGTSTWSRGFPNETGRWLGAFVGLSCLLLCFTIACLSCEWPIVDGNCLLISLKLSYFLYSYFKETLLNLYVSFYMLLECSVTEFWPLSRWQLH